MIKKLFLGAIFFCVCIVSAKAQLKFIDQSGIDRAVRPGDDFNSYANGTWTKTNEIPITETSWGNASIIKKQTRLRLEQLVMDVSQQKNRPGSNAQKLESFYKSGMDTMTIEKLGIKPVLGDLKKIAAINNIKGIMTATIAQYASGLAENAPLFNMENMADPINNDVELITFNQGGMGLPEKDFYFNQDDKSVSVRNKYKSYLQQLLELTGRAKEGAKTSANAILLLETRLAKGARTATENRDFSRLLNYYTVDSLNKQFPQLAWNNIFQTLNIQTGKIILFQPEFFDILNKELSATPLNIWKDYLSVRLLDNSAKFLSNSFTKAKFAFYSTALLGQAQMKPRGEELVSITDAKLGEILGKLYIEKNFTADAKKRMNELVQNLIETFVERIKSNSWMNDSTRNKALEKMATIRRKIAYPDNWRDYSTLAIGNNFYGNVRSASAFEFRYKMNLVGKPIDRNKWDMTPPTLNAYYNPFNNEIVFPAGILLPPFFDPKADDAVNYGGIATVIGHEISHGFDDQGSGFNAAGQYKNWWTKTDRDNFNTKGAALANQFNKYIALDTLHVNGSLTLGENIADLCGVTVAYQAFKKTAQGKGNVLIDGLTPDQRFFLSYAAIWRGKSTPEKLRSSVLTNEHAPPVFRVNGPLSNFDPFYAAFNLKEGDKMWRPVSERVVIW
ncbi:MAG: M13 family metallopeptidase [Ferruginibacter sp.]|nr:M13 family metallopeptidase [Ferruginibacter sp.]